MARRRCAVTRVTWLIRTHVTWLIRTHVTWLIRTHVTWLTRTHVTWFMCIDMYALYTTHRYVCYGWSTSCAGSWNLATRMSSLFLCVLLPTRSLHSCCRQDSKKSRRMPSLLRSLSRECVCVCVCVCICICVRVFVLKIGPCRPFSALRAVGVCVFVSASASASASTSWWVHVLMCWVYVCV